MSASFFPKNNLLMACDSTSGDKGGGGLAKRQRINANDRVQLHDYFGSKNWALNTNMSRGNAYANSKIGKIATDLSFS